MTKRTMVSIPKTEYSRLKKMEKVDFELLDKLVQGLEDIKAGRVREWK